MVATPLKVLALLAGGAGAAAGAAGVAYVAGALDFLSGDQPSAIASVDPAAPKDEPAPKGERVGEGEAAALVPPVADPAKPEEKAEEQAALTPPADTAAPADAATPPAPAATPPPASDTAPPAAEDKKPEQGKPAAAAQTIVPSFDIVRVEGDGSIVIAGKAPPSAYVEVITGSVVIAGVTATVEGDFAAVPDEPLKPGDYQVMLRAIAPGNVVTLSDETALISIPEKADGQVLAMVEKPGEASKLISVPQPVEEKKPAEVAAAEPATPPAAEPKDDAKPADAAAAPEPKADKPAEQDVAAAEPAKPDEKGAVATPPAADAGGGVKAEAVAPPAEDAKPADKPAEVAAAEPKPADDPKPADVVAAAPKADEAAAEAPAQPAAPAAKVIVEAVEIEGKKIFVAGAADAGSPVRVYANEILLGDTRASPEGRFLVEAVRELPVGSYIIRADLLSEDGKQVVARAAVPFEREPGEMVAAVAPPAAAPTPEPKPDTAVPTPEPKPDAAAPVPEPKPDTAAAVPEPKPAVETPVPEPMPDTAMPTPSPKPDEAKPADVAAVPEPKPDEAKPADVAAAPAEPKDATPPAATEPKPAEEVAAADAATPPAAGGVELPKLDNGIAGTPPEVLSPKLESVQSAVIIRRGDSLWRISKRVYGRGVRYSTIYLANQDQITDPGRIWPGQVFKVPGKTTEGEAADMTAVGEQATTMQ